MNVSEGVAVLCGRWGRRSLGLGQTRLLEVWHWLVLRGRQGRRAVGLLSAEVLWRRGSDGNVSDGVRHYVTPRGGLLVISSTQTLLQTVAVHLVLEVTHLLVNLLQDARLVSSGGKLTASHRAPVTRLGNFLEIFIVVANPIFSLEFVISPETRS